jgi:hypothetical protein
VIDAAGAIYVLGGSGTTGLLQDVWASTDGGADRTKSGVVGGYWVGTTRGTTRVLRGYWRGTGGVMAGSSVGVPRCSKIVPSGYLGYSRGTRGVV